MPLNTLAEKDYLNAAASLTGMELTFEGLQGSVHGQVAAIGFRLAGITDFFECLNVIVVRAFPKLQHTDFDHAPPLIEIVRRDLPGEFDALPLPVRNDNP